MTNAMSSLTFRFCLSEKHALVVRTNVAVDTDSFVESSDEWEREPDAASCRQVLCLLHLSFDRSEHSRSSNLQKWRQRQFLAVLLKQSKHFKQILAAALV